MSETLEMILRAGGCDSDEEFDDEDMPELHRFALRNDLEGMQRCIDAGAAVDQRASDEATPFLSATAARRWEAAEFLLKMGADIDAVCEEAGCALNDVIEDGDMERLQWLLSRGAHPELNMGDYNPLYVAIRANRADMVEALLRHGADPDPRGPSKKPLALARELRHRACEAAICSAIEKRSQ
jgi:ankyrin repeat protein